MKNKILLAALALVFSSPVGARSLPSWGLNDVSVLIPLPQTEKDFSRMLAPSSSGPKGALLPPSVLERFRFPFVNGVTNEEAFSLLRVVGVRIDPCFGSPCQRQVRLVWQPVRRTPQGKVSTFDAAFHSFYLFEEKEFSLIAKELLQLNASKADKSLPLDIHPILKTQGFKGTYWHDFKKILLRHLGEENLIQVTQMAIRGGNSVWAFSGFARNDSFQWQAVGIPGIDRDVQNFMNQDLSGQLFEGGVFPVASQLVDFLDRVLTMSWWEDVRVRPQVAAETYDRLLRMENPGLHNPDTLDCVSCHTAQPARLHLEKHFAREILPATKKGLFTSPFPLTNPSAHPESTIRVRAFGYFEDEIAVNQRVIHESAVTAERMNRDFR